MKKVLFTILLFAFHESFAQTIEPIKHVKPTSYIGIINAGIRRNVFINFKYKSIKDASLNTELMYSPQNFLDLLNAVTILSADSTTMYDGLRTYFALTKKNNGYVLNLIFVPTSYGGLLLDNTIVHNDNIDNCWIITDDGLQHISSKEASDFIKNYDTSSIKKAMEDDGKRRASEKFLETNSLWYDIKYLKGNTNHNGLIDYLNDLINSSKIDSVFVKFAGFGPFSKYHYNLSLIFNFYKKGISNTSFTFSKTSDTEKQSLSNSGNTDTGVPCPPPPSGQSACPGTKLPQ